jgi:hypothetical protein
MNNSECKLLDKVFEDIGFDSIQDVEDYILTITSYDNSLALCISSCKVRCFLLYLMKHNIFEYNRESKKSNKIIVIITNQSISEISDLLEFSSELKDLILYGLTHGLLISTRNTEEILDKIS